MLHAAIGTGAVGGRRVVAVIAALIVLMLSAGQAQASAPGSGVANGWEYAAEDQAPFGSLCGKFVPTGLYGPLKIYLEMDPGTWHGTSGTGTALFTSTNDDYHASPVGTYGTDSTCTIPGGVPGTLTVEFGSYTCATVGDTATYMRTATSAYTVTAPLDCDGDQVKDTDVMFEGAQTLCPCFPPDPDPVDPVNGPSGTMTGTYLQT